MARPKFIKVPFASSGDVEDVPNDAAPDGSVSYEEGFPPLYSEDPTDTGLLIERGDMNGLFLALSGGLQEFQTQGVPDVITNLENGGSAYSYAINALVRSDNKIFRSLVAGNTEAVVNGSNWREEFKQADWGDADPLSSGFIKNKPSLTGATTSATGTVQLATVTEADEGVNSTKAVTPRGLEEARKRTNALVLISGVSFTVNGAQSGNIIYTTSGSAITCDVELSGPSPFVAGDVITFIAAGSGQLSIVAGAGITINKPSALTNRTREQYSTISLVFLDPTNAVLSGDLEQS